jgi:hypothetical protein
MWQGLLALKADQAAVQMHFVHGNRDIALESLPLNSDRSTPPLRIVQRMRLEQTQIEGVHRKMQVCTFCGLIEFVGFVGKFVWFLGNLKRKFDKNLYDFKKCWVFKMKFVGF